MTLTQSRFRSAVLAMFVSALGACGGGGSAGSPAPPVTTPAPTPPAAVAPDFSAIGAEVERFSVADVTLIIGDATGELYRYEKGAVAADTPLDIASASKLLTGLALWRLVEAGTLSLDDTPQDHINGWTDDSDDARSRVTLDHLISFRSGFNTPPTGGSCAGQTAVTLGGCVASIYAEGVESEPGTAYAYGPSHMQIAALMARGATGEDLYDTVREMFDAVGASAASGFPQDDNVRYSGGAVATAGDYGKVLTALLSGTLVSDRPGFLTDRTADSTFLYRPLSQNDVTLDWHYGAGFWLECDRVPFANECANATPTISSIGAFGFTPWVDFEAGYWAVLAMQERLTLTSRPTISAIEFQQMVQPMIEAEFD